MAARLRAELEARRVRNPRYSLRAFARDLGVHHTDVSRWLRGRRPLTPTAARIVGERLNLDARAIECACSERADDAVFACVARADFVPSSRFLATRTGLSVDIVNAALFRLLRASRLSMNGHRLEVHG